MKNAVMLRGLLYCNGRLVSDQVITTQFLQKIVDNLQADASLLHLYKYHETGQGTTVATATDTAIESAIMSGVRTAGSQTEPAGEPTTYRTVSSILYDNAYNISEWGLFSLSSGGLLLDRAVFTAVPVASSETVDWTFDLEFQAS
jgi:hypothetical protein